jgi:polysaccharide pyruvyl transferase WcaK-like protein
LKIFRNKKTNTDEAKQRKTESIVSDQLSQLNEKEQYFLGLMKKADTTNRPVDELLALSYITQYKNPDIPEIQQQRTLVKLHELLDASENEELKKIREIL